MHPCCGLKSNRLTSHVFYFAAIIIIYSYESSNTHKMLNSDDQIDDQISALGSKCMDYLVGNPEELSNFMTHAGISPDALRENFASREIAIGAIDYFAHNESALLAMCANAGFNATTFMGVWHRFNAQS